MLDENRNAVFTSIWSVEMCFMFVAQINIIFMRPLYEAVILCDCIIKSRTNAFHIILSDPGWCKMEISSAGESCENL